MLELSITRENHMNKTDHPLYNKVGRFVEDWDLYLDQIAQIQKLKKEKNAIILAHNYITPDIFHSVADIVGDSLALAKKAAEVEAEVIVVCGVHFMAETAKLLNPTKKVIIPDLEAGCSLAESMTPQDVKDLRKKHPGAPVITYVNTSAALKAECDVCCTSGNALKIVEAFPNDKIIFIPDQHLAHYISTQTNKEIITWEGSCEVHIEFDAEEIKIRRSEIPGLAVIAHPECPKEILEASDFVGSTANMLKYVQDNRPENIFMVTERSLAENIESSFPEVNFIDSCKTCPHMKLMTMDKVLKCLQNMEAEVEVPVEVALPARRSVERMLEIS